jgi:tRNA uridine 5-carboxymethylaminomethyl modification enzyme
VAGLNAARSASGAGGVTFDRAESYIGVLIDDLVTRGVSEPYRMFTSRSEYRLSLRIDNAGERLTRKGVTAGCVGSKRAAFFERSHAVLAGHRASLERLTLSPSQAAKAGLELNRDGVRRTAFELLSYPHISFERLQEIWPELASVGDPEAERLKTDATYAVYLERQASDLAAHQRDESLVLAEGIAFDALPGLSNEIKAKLDRVRPRTLGQAGRIEGVTPAALTLLAAHVRRSQPRVEPAA